MDRYLYSDDQAGITGPIPLEAILKLGLPPTTPVKREGSEHWTTLGAVSPIGPKLLPVTPPVFEPPPSQPPACPKEGEPQLTTPSQVSNSPSFLTTFFLCLFLGGLGAHRFYLKNKWRWAQLLTLGGCGVWALVDLILILLSKFKDNEGRPILNTKPKLAWGVSAFWCVLVISSSATQPAQRASGSSPSRRGMSTSEARAREYDARQWAQSRIESTTNSKVVQIDSWGWDESSQCHVFGGLIDSPRSESYMKFDIRVGIDASGEWKVIHVNINQ